jgi:DNA-binding CsgD family transcriptional regulator
VAAAARATTRGAGLAVQLAGWSAAVLHNGLGQYADALAAAEEADVEPHGRLITAWVLPELIEAAVRSGDEALAGRALSRLSAVTAAGGTDWALGIEARSRGLLSTGEAARRCFAMAVTRLRRTEARPDLARAHLLYGEWLRRKGRRLEAREQLRTAYDLFAPMGAEAFAERARRELLATGQKVRKRDVSSRNELTPQEAHIARLAGDGRTNPEIGAELFLSARTVEWHLRKVFTKLGITSRKDLQEALPTRSRLTSPPETQLLKG